MVKMIGNDIIITQSHMEQPDKQNNVKPTCSVCGTTENVRWVGGYQPYLCNSQDCIPF
jgi:hypothetical protein